LAERSVSITSFLTEQTKGFRVFFAQNARKTSRPTLVQGLAAIAKAAVQPIDIDVDALAAEVLKRLRENGDLMQVNPAELVAELLGSIDN